MFARKVFSLWINLTSELKPFASSIRSFRSTLPVFSSKNGELNCEYIYKSFGCLFPTLKTF